MLKSLTLRNFRAFKTQTFDFSKINIFVGPNNSGKSSAISAINLLSQTINNPDIDSSPLILNGQFDSLGTFIDLVHGNRANTPLGIDIGFDDFTVKLDYKYRASRREIDLVKFELLEGQSQVISYMLTKDSYELKVLGRKFEDALPGVKKRKPTFYNLMPLNSLVNPIYRDLEFSSVSDTNRITLVKIDRSLSRARIALRRTFGRFDSVSPFRDRPQRTYLYSGETAQRIGSTGSNTALMLSSDNSKRGSESLDMIAEISRWFKVSGIAEAVRVKSLTPRHFEIVLCDTRGNEHNICDVGFGCSQVLPVLTATLNIFAGIKRMDSRAQPLIVIQEPEIHLHPNAQAALGSFFTGLLRPGGQIFLETHSDNMVLRIARHVADNTLSPEDVRIFYVHKEDGVSIVDRVQVSAEGVFVPEWPGGFFPQRQSESLSLARAAFHGKNHSTSTEQFEFKYPEEAQ